MESDTSRNIKATVAHKHEDFINQFQLNRTKIVKDKLRQIETLEKSIEKYEQRKKDSDRLTATEHMLLFQMQKEKKALEEELRKINEKEAEHHYFLKTSHVLTEYDKTHLSNNSLLQQSLQSKNKNPASQKNSILSFMKPNSNTNSITPSSTNPSNNPSTNPSTNPSINSSINSSIIKDKNEGENKITTFFNRSEGATNRAQLQDIYMQQIDSNYISKEKYKTCNENIFKCPNPDCGAIDDIIYNYNLGRRNCNVCGIQIDFFFDPSFNSYKATASIELTPEFPYRRENHVSEWLAKIQGKENTEIPESVFTALENEFKKNRIKDYKTLNPDFVKKCLKELKLNKYYDHKEYIIHRFNGLPPPQLSIELEDTLKRMFMQIQDPFEKYCPSTRKNFLSYSYVFHKFCQLLELDDLLVYFPLLKSREKLFEQDKIWKQICKDLRWQYIPSL